MRSLFLDTGFLIALEAADDAQHQTAANHWREITAAKPLPRQAWRYFVRHEDKSYSLVDCSSFVMMEQLGLREALAFDKHFAQAGFARTPLGEKA